MNIQITQIMTHQNHSLNLVVAVGRVILDEIGENIFTRVEVIPCKTYGVIIVHRIVVIYEFPIRPSAGEYLSNLLLGPYKLLLGDAYKIGNGVKIVQIPT